MSFVAHVPSSGNNDFRSHCSPDMHQTDNWLWTNCMDMHEIHASTDEIGAYGACGVSCQIDGLLSLLELFLASF